MRRLGSYLPPLKWKLIAAAICTVFASCGTLGVGGSTKYFIDAITSSQNTGDMSTLNRYTLIAIAVFAVRAFFTYGQTYFMANAAQRLAMRLRNQVFARLQRQSLSFFDTNKTGNLMSSISNDVPAVQHNLTSIIQDVASAPVIFVGGIALLFWLNWRLAAVSLLGLPAIAFLIITASRRMRKNMARLQSSLAEVTEVAEETLAGHRTVKAFANEQHEIVRFEAKSTSVFRDVMKSVQVRAIMSPVMEMFSMTAVLAVLWFGGREIVHGGQSLTTGGLFSFVVIIREIADAARSMANVSVNLAGTSAAAARLFALLDVQLEVQDRPGARQLAAVSGRVEFDSVEFAYRGGIPVLKDVKFTMEPGQVVALVGRSGAGKSTIAALIPRFYEVTGGAVRVDGHDVRDVTVESLRSHIGIVPQDPHLFSGAIYENIEYGRLGASQAEIIAAAIAANAHEFILELPAGYQTLVGERGVRLSGGQRQRISIARAILRDPRILILDEATSSLDTQSEALVQDALARLVAERTTLVIAHRLSTIRHADVILVVDQGQIVERGPHDQLLALGGVYAQLYRTQFRFEAERKIAASAAG